MSEEIEPHILRKFDIIQKLGKGAYGIVWKAIDRKYKQVVALKKVFDAFHNATDAQRTFREVMFLQEINGHENIVRLLNIIKAENNKDLYLVFDFMETDLHAVIRANILEEIHKQYIIYQILKALKYIHSGDLIHRDLKPSNILLNSECHAKVADFGLARSVAADNNDDGNNPVLTEYVATRWYRAPEILLGSTKYSKAVDMWSVGCILGELIVGKAIFPGTSTLNQIERVLELIGKPKPEDIESIESQLAWNIIGSINITKKKSFHSFFPKASETALDLIRKLLSFNPNNRLTAEESLKHKYVEQFSSPEEEIVCDTIIKISMNDNKKFSIREYREALYADIAKRKKEQRKKWQAKYLSQLGVQTEQTTSGYEQPQQQQYTTTTTTQSTKQSEKQQSQPTQQSMQQSTSTTQQQYYQGSTTQGQSKYDTKERQEEKALQEKKQSSNIQSTQSKTSTSTGSYGSTTYSQGGSIPQKQTTQQTQSMQSQGTTSSMSKQSTSQVYAGYKSGSGGMISSNTTTGGTSGAGAGGYYYPSGYSGTSNTQSRPVSQGYGSQSYVQSKGTTSTTTTKTTQGGFMKK